MHNSSNNYSYHILVCLQWYHIDSVISNNVTLLDENERGNHTRLVIFCLNAAIAISVHYLGRRGGCGMGNNYFVECG